VQLEQLIHPAPLGLEKYRPQLSYLLLDEGQYTQAELCSLKNLVAALFQLENSRSEPDIQAVLVRLIDWLRSPEQTSLRRAFTVWLNRVLLPAKAVNTPQTELNDLHEVQAMLAERVKQWTKEWENQGIVKGRQEGRLEGRQEQAAKLFLVLLESKFGAVGLRVQDKINDASPEQIELWTKHIFHAKSPEELLDS
jgi:hypothetical protein